MGSRMSKILKAVVVLVIIIAVITGIQEGGYIAGRLWATVLLAIAIGASIIITFIWRVLQIRKKQRVSWSKTFKIACKETIKVFSQKD